MALPPAVAEVPAAAPDPGLGTEDGPDGVGEIKAVPETKVRVGSALGDDRTGPVLHGHARVVEVRVFDRSDTGTRLEDLVFGVSLAGKAAALETLYAGEAKSRLQ